jgi:hypothetical protein
LPVSQPRSHLDVNLRKANQLSAGLPKYWMMAH